MTGCKKQLLYETEAPGLLYLTLDGHDTLYVGFQHKMRVEICLAQKGEFGESQAAAEVLLTAGEEDGVHESDTIKVLPVKEEVLSLVDNVSYGRSVPLPESKEIERTSSISFNTKTLSSVSAEKQMNSKTLATNVYPGKVKMGNSVTGIQRTRANGVEQNNPSISDKPKRSLNALRRIVPMSSERHKVILQKQKEKFPLARRKQKQALQTMLQKKKEDLQRKKDQRKQTSVILSKEQLSNLVRLSRMKQGKVLSEEKSPASSSLGDLATAEGETITGEIKHDEDSSCSAPESETESKVKAIKCEYCAVTFPTKRQYYKHRKVKSEKYHLCLKCQTAFPFRAYLLAHMKYHNDKTKRDRYDCSECNVSSKTLPDLKRHMMTHTAEHCFKCCLCTKTFSTQPRMHDHMRLHTAPGMIKCSCCNQFFPSRAALTEHKKSLRKIECRICGEEFPNTISLRIHYKCEHSDQILRCTSCDHIYATQEEMDAHMIKHTKRRKKQCRICGISVIRLRQHELTHTPLEQMADTEVFMCDQCPSRFRAKSTLKAHVLNMHSKVRLKCHICHQSYSSKTCLNRHLTDVHSTLMPYQCEVCGKRCKQRSNLRVHMRIHSSTKMFPCNLCDQAFNYKASLQGHIRSKHSSESKSAAPEVYPPAESSEGQTSSVAVSAWSLAQPSGAWEDNDGKPSWDKSTCELSRDVTLSGLPSVTDFAIAENNSSVPPLHMNHNDTEQSQR